MVFLDLVFCGGRAYVECSDFKLNVKNVSKNIPCLNVPEIH